MARYKYTITDLSDGSTTTVSKRDFLHSLGYNCAVRAAYGDDPDGRNADEDFDDVLFLKGEVEVHCNGFVYKKSEVTKCYC